MQKINKHNDYECLNLEIYNFDTHVINEIKTL